MSTSLFALYTVIDIFYTYANIFLNKINCNVHINISDKWLHDIFTHKTQEPDDTLIILIKNELDFLKKTGFNISYYWVPDFDRIGLQNFCSIFCGFFCFFFFIQCYQKHFSLLVFAEKANIHICAKK